MASEQNRRVLLLAASVLTAGLAVGAQTPEGGPAPRHGFMHPDAAARTLARARFNSLPVAVFQTGAQARAQAHAVNLLSQVATQGAVRDQGNNGDCWVWSGTAMTEVELKAKYGITDRLSTQYADALMSTTSWANGGYFYDFAQYLTTGGILVPWSNGNAAYVDGSVDSYCTQSLVPLSQIQLSPAYTHAVLKAALIPTNGGQAAAIAALKAALDAGHAVAFDFYTNFTGTGGFDDWWNNNDETVLWPEPGTGTTGMTYDASTWGGHEVAIIGYDESDAVAANHYWILLNSWGVPANRPNGCFRMPMAMNYDSTVLDGGSPMTSYAFGTLALTMDAPAVAAPTVTANPADVLVDQDLPFTLKGAVVGYPPFSYQWFNGATAMAGATSAWYTDPVPAPGDSGQYTLVVTDRAGTAVTSAPAQVVVEPLAQLLTNPGLETPPDGQGNIPGWTYTSSGMPTGYESPYRSSANAHTGSGYLFLGNVPDSASALAPASGTVFQTVTLPATGTPTLSLWVHMVTQETAASNSDTVKLQVQNASGVPLATLKTYTNQQVDHLNWAQDTFSLSTYANQTIRIALVWACTTTQQTLWRVDDLALTLAYPPTSVPSVSAFSPAGGLPGATVTLTGTGFLGAAAVSFNGVLQSAFTVLSDTQLITTVPAGATPGPIAVLNALGTGPSPSSFLVKTLDFDGQGVDVDCMADLAAAFGSQTGDANWSPVCDLNGDGTVTALDVTLFLANF